MKKQILSILTVVGCITVFISWFLFIQFLLGLVSNENNQLFLGGVLLFVGGGGGIGLFIAFLETMQNKFEL